MKKLLLALIVFTTIQANAQVYPVYNHFYMNPFLYNPAEVGSSGFTELNFNYRRQWTGMEDAPITHTFNVQHNTNKNISLGASFYSDKTVLLNTTSALGAVAYRVDISKDQYMKFGLSMGVGFNNFDIANAKYPEDRAILNTLNQTTFLNGQFGFTYKNKGLQLGFAMPQIFDYRAVDMQTFQEVRFDQLKHLLFTGRYRFSITEGVFDLEPIVLYRHGAMYLSQYEVSMMGYIKESIWVGANYRETYGTSALLGLKASDWLSVGYAYEFGSKQTSQLGAGTHEIHLSVRMGKQKHFGKTRGSYGNMRSSQPSRNFNKVDTRDKSTPEPMKNRQASQVEKTPNAIKTHEYDSKNQTPAESQEFILLEQLYDDPEDILVSNPEAVLPDLPKEGTENLEPGHYVVIGVFNYEENAINFAKKSPMPAEAGFHAKKGHYYVYVKFGGKYSDVKDSWMRIKEKSEYKDSWVFVVK